MPFCQGCGKQIGDDAKFCVSCGRPLAAGSAATPAPALAEAQPPTVDIPAIAYSIEGDSMQALRVKLTPGQEVFAEAGRMVFKTNSVSWETRASGATLAERLFGMLKRSISGESLFFTYFNCPAGEGEVGFAGAYPGKLQEIQLAEGQSFLAHRDAFICAESSVSFSVAFVKKLGAGLFGGEGFILEKFNGPG